MVAGLMTSAPAPAHAVMPPYDAENVYALPPSALSKKTLAERFDELFDLATKSEFYTPDPYSMKSPELCYHMMIATDSALARAEIYKTCFYGGSARSVVDAYKVLLNEQFLALTGGLTHLRFNDELADYVKSLLITFFEGALTDKNSKEKLSLNDLYINWQLGYSELILKLNKEQKRSIFLESYFNFTKQMQLSRKYRKTDNQLFEALESDIKAQWPEDSSFKELSRAKKAEDVLGFRVLRTHSSCIKIISN